jgi:hypothetical protein
MPRIEELRVVLFLWVAWEQDDYGNRTNISLGFSRDHARRRCVRRVP